MNIFGYTITMKKTPKRKTGYRSKTWTKSETDTALRMRNEGQPTEKIASLLGRTVASVNARIWKVRKK